MSNRHFSSETAVSESRILKKDSLFQLQRVATREGTRLLVKFAVSAPSLPGDDALLEHEFRVFRNLDSAHVLMPLRLGRGDALTAEYADVDGAVLAADVRNRFEDVGDLAALVRSVCAPLAFLHERRWLLLGVTPASFLRDLASHAMILADAPFAVRVGDDSREADHGLRGEYLAYAAPEVTGRVPFPVDVHADLYSLGAVLYHLLSGRPPFVGDDAAGLIHSHLAKAPRHLADCDLPIPRGASDVVMRLLAKSPSDRFESVATFEDQLLRSLGGPTTRSSLRLRRARPGAAGASRISSELYGMDATLGMLSEKFSRTRSAPEVIFVEGEPGVGKSSLLTRSRALLRHGHLCHGSFLSTTTAPPLAGWASALRELANVLLTKPAADADRWRKMILAELGEGAGLVAQLVPEWAALLATQLRPDGPADGALNRLAVAIHGLLRCFGQADTPVVLLLDDLQWADVSSIRILQLVLTLAESINLLVVCALRNTPVQGPAAAAIASLRAAVASTRLDSTTLQLRAWGRAEMRAFLSDSFGAGFVCDDTLVQFLLVRTEGNPFFVRELVQSVIDGHLVEFDPESGSWFCSVDALQALPPAESVVVFLTRKIVALSAELIDALKIAACLGPRFTLREFTVASGFDSDVAFDRLDRAAVEGLLLVLSETPSRPRTSAAEAPEYAFAHDRVLEACRGLLSEEARAAVCLRIARALLATHGPEPNGEVAHRVAAYFAAAGSLVSTDDERLSVAGLALRAGTFATQSGAFSQALEQFREGLERMRALGPDGPREDHVAAWTQYPDLTRALLESSAEAALLNGALDLVHTWCGVLLAHAETPLHRARSHEIRLRALNAAKRFPEAVEVGCTSLAELGVRFPRSPKVLHAIAAYVGTRRRLLGAPPDKLTAPVAGKDAAVKATFRIMQSMYSSSYFGRPALFPLVVCRHIDASLRHGNDDYSCVTYVAFSIVLCARRDFTNASKLATIAQELLKRPGAEGHTAKVFLGQYMFVFPWSHHLRDSLPHMTEGIRIGIQVGDFEYASHLLTAHSVARFHCGVPLAELETEYDHQLARVASLRQERSTMLEQLFRQLVHDLRRGATDAPPLAGPFYVGSEMLPQCLDPLDQNLAFSHFMAEMLVWFMRGEAGAALSAAARAREFFEGASFGLYLGPVFVFWEATISSRSPAHSSRERRRILSRLSKASRILRTAARTAPMNFSHRHHLVEAERCRLLGREHRAAWHYERSIELANAHEYLPDAAVAQECAAEFYLERQMDRLARHYLRDSYASYARWGSATAMRRLELGHPQHFAVFASSPASSDSIPPALPRPEQLDYRALLRSSQALSGEVRLPNLLERLLRTMFEHAGAQRALLVLERGSRLHVVAEADVDTNTVAFIPEEPTEETSRLSRSIVRYVATTAKAIVLDDAGKDERFNGDPYVVERAPRSVLCVPIVNQRKLLGLAYLENNRVSHVFTAARLEIATLLAGQAGISIAGARLHALELEAQQAKINPHFLFNALSSIADLALEDGGRAEDAILKLARLYRYVLATSQDAPVTLGQELEVVRNYLELERLRFGSKLDFQVSCEDGATEVRVPGLLVQPLVENAIRHGIAPKLAPGTVWVQATRSGDRCRIVVHDNGDGADHGTGGTGFGLRSVQQRLALVFGGDFTIAISRRAGYRVELEVPVRAASDPSLTATAARPLAPR